MRRLSGFSLMEMMVVLMIVAIVAAVSAPMMSKKAIKTASDGSPWSWVQNDPNESIWYRGNNGIALIGTARRPNGLNTRLYIDNNNSSTPHISLGSNGNNIFNLSVDGSSNNIAFSNIALVSSAKDSIAIGHGAAASNHCQVVVGTSATSAYSESVAIGYNAKGDKECSTAVGASANSTKQAYGTALGYRATTTAAKAIAIGAMSEASSNYAIAIGAASHEEKNAGKSTTASGTNAIAIGAGAIANQNDSVAIGAGVQTAAANEIRIGDENSRVVIPGTLVPEKLELKNLHLTGGLVVDGPVVLSNKSGCVMMRENVDKNHPLWLFAQTAGSSDWGEMQAYDGATINVMGNKYYSDRRLKNIGKLFTAGLAEIKKLEVFNYTFKDDKSKTPRVGVMAQDLQKIFPNAVMKGEDGFLRIRMEDMFYALVNAVKELDARSSAQDKKIKELEKRLEALENAKAN